MRFRFATALFLSVGFLTTALVAAQQRSATSNPLDDLREGVKRVLGEAGLPFSEEQERAIILMTEDRRQASEELFGETMDFRGGPVQGQQMDRAVAALQWMQAEFSKRLGEYLTPEQLTVWTKYEAARETETGAARGRGGRGGANAGASSQQQRTQFIRINNNAFAAEEGFFAGGRGFGGGGGPGGGGPGGGMPGGGGGGMPGGGGGGMPGGGGGRGGPGGPGGGGPEVIERGGTGAFHGQGSFNLQDESLNARNPFASNKPPYQERQVSGNFSGPVVRNRLSVNVSASQNEAQNVDTVHATTPAGIFDLGIVRPNVNRNAGLRGTYQFTDGHSLIFGVRHGTNTQENQFVGGFTLPERASSSVGHNSNFDIRQFSVFSENLIYETSFQIQRGGRKNKPLTEGVAVNVLDAFRGGGAQDKSENSNIDYFFGNLLTRMGQVWTVKTGFTGSYRTNDNVSSNNFDGTYTFSSLEDYVAGIPLTYRVTRGDPRVVVPQLETSAFMQNDIKVNQRLTLMLGVRYDWQTNLDDHNNIAPRVGFAYAMGRSLVVRGGVGMFYQRVIDEVILQQRRLDGTRQYEIVINNPSWPDPFQSGTVTLKYPSSVRITDPDLVAPYNVIAQVAVEKTFRNNLFVSVTYDRGRGMNFLRSRNLNAPLPGETGNPDPTRGDVLRLESTAQQTNQNLRISARQRFSIFNVNASYSTGSSYNHSDRWDNPPSNNYDLESDWGRAGFRQPYNFNVSLNAQLPVGIFLSGTLQRNGGQPYTITTGKDENHDGQTSDRPAGIPRNSADGPSFESWAFNISKAIFFGAQAGSRSGTNLNMFANMSNAFNRTNYGTPSGVMTSPYFGQSYSARNPREIEVGVRFNF